MQVSRPMYVILRSMGVCLLGAGIFFFTVFFETPSNTVFTQGGKNPKAAIKRNDKNGDGKVSRDEWRKSPAIFDQIDANGDGYLTVEEFRVRFSDGGGEKRTRSKDSTEKNADKSDVAISGTRGTWYGDGRYWQGPIIDAHSQVDQNV